MGAGHDHGHGGGRSRSTRPLALTLGLAASYMVAEVIGGLWTNSLALLADAGHMLSDVAALALALFAIWIAKRPPDPRRTYGYYRAEILAALANGATLVAIALFIGVEAWERFREPREVQGGAMMVIAAGGLIVNVAGLLILRGQRNESLNVRGAWLHVFTDMLGSVQAIIAGALIWAFGWNWVDPVASLLISLLVIYSSWHLLKEATAVLMEGAPGNIDVDEVRETLRASEGVAAVHDLHVWTISSGLVALSAHVIAESGATVQVAALRAAVHERFGIDHVTLQVEAPGQEQSCQHC